MAVILRRALRAPVPVMVVAGHGAAMVRHRLRADPRVELVLTPRGAIVLVVAGRIPTDDAAALLQVHDQLPSPRAVVAVDATGLPAELSVSRTVAGPDLVDDVLATGRAVLEGTVDTPFVLPAANPVPWRGVGPNGQGGEGMMGGVPYGRPMAMPPIEGRDGLALDRLQLVLGPWLPGLPVGCRIEAGLQGDVLEQARVRFTGAASPAPGVPLRIQDLERFRARTLLGWLGDLADLAGLPAEARRISRLALAPDAAGIATIRRRLERRFSLRLATDGVGVLDRDAVADRGLGWLARAQGIPEDRRLTDPAYDGLDVPAPHDLGPDVTGRWRTWLEEADVAVVLAERAGDRTTDDPELPWGAGDVHDAKRTIERERLADQLLAGAELGRAMLCLASLPGAADAAEDLLAGVPA